MSWWFLVVDALATYRLAVLLVNDGITQPLRDWVIARDRLWLTELSTCIWCLSIWIGAGVVALTRFIPGAWQYAAMALALSGAAGFLAEHG
jgi:hypothetical protein